MILKFTDRTEMFVSTTEGEGIRKALTKSAEGFVTVRGVTIKKTSISKIEPGGVDPKINLFDKPSKELATGQLCRAEKPLGLELIRLAKHNPKLLADKQWREDQKQKLRAQSDWCDGELNTCACSDPVPAIA